ncbi:MAG: glycosyltransferase [Bdellovibrionota bacterium]
MIYSIAIPVRDGAATLPRLLEALSQQRTQASVEIVAVDSGSRDGSVEILRAAKAEVFEIPPEEFGHGRTRNLLLSKTRGEIVFLFSQDAVPLDERYLDSLATPILTSKQVAGAYAKQIPGASAHPLERLRWRRSPAGGNVPFLSEIPSPGNFEKLPPERKRRLCEFHSAACAIRRSAWEKISFPDVPIGEDVAWARAALLARYSLAFEPGAVVEHSHHRPLDEEQRRIRAEAALEWRLFGYAPVVSALGVVGHTLLRGAGDALAVLGGEGTFPQKISALPRAAAFAWARSLGYYQGYRDALSRRAP